jgi:LPXTG-motif cell wall-anchored protein
MKKMTLLIAPLVLAVAFPLATESVASADPSPSISACSFSPTSNTMSPGDTVNATYSWSDINGGTAPGSDAVYVEFSQDGTVQGGSVAPAFPSSQSNPVTVPYTFDQLSQSLNGAAGTIRYGLFATDGTAKVGSELCSISFSVAAAPSSTTTTTTVPVTLPHTGSNSSGYVVASGAAIVLGGLFLATSARRRRA